MTVNNCLQQCVCVCVCVCVGGGGGGARHEKFNCSRMQIILNLLTACTYACAQIINLSPSLLTAVGLCHPLHLVAATSKNDWCCIIEWKDLAAAAEVHNLAG